MANATVPANVQQARLLVQTTDQFAMCYLMLADYAYAGQKTAVSAYNSIKATFANIRQPSVAPSTVPASNPVPDCHWDLDWGPFASDDNSNLALAAKLMDPASGLPIMGVIAIRGTAIYVLESGNCRALINQVDQDLDVGTLVPWTYNGADTGAQVAKGSLTGFQNKILTLGGDMTAAKWAAQFATDYPGAPIVVTGHSLGGCQATLLSAYLVSTDGGLPAGTVLLPNPIAGPTAGDVNFANMYDGLFSTTARRWYNTYDIVPAAFEADTFANIPNMWNGAPYNCGTSYEMGPPERFEYGRIAKQIAGKTYTQPSSGARPMTGQCSYGTMPSSYFGMLTLQHFPPAYQFLMAKVPGVANVDYPAPIVVG